MSSTHLYSSFGSEQPTAGRESRLSLNMGNIYRQSPFPRYRNYIYNSKEFDENNLQQFRILNLCRCSLSYRTLSHSGEPGSSAKPQVCKSPQASAPNPTYSVTTSMNLYSHLHIQGPEYLFQSIQVSPVLFCFVSFPFRHKIYFN